MNRNLSLSFVIVSLLSAIPIPLTHAQSVIMGTVTDDLERLLAGVLVEIHFSLLTDNGQHVILEGSAHNTSRIVYTDSWGAYVLNDLPPGMHTVTFTKDRYVTMVVEGIELQPNAVRQVDVRQEPGSLFKTVTIDDRDRQSPIFVYGPSEVPRTAAIVVQAEDWNTSVPMSTVTVRATEQSLGYDSRITTDERGRGEFDLEPGIYALEFALLGFYTFVVDGIELMPNTQIEITARMIDGATSSEQSVTFSPAFSLNGKNTYDSAYIEMKYFYKLDMISDLSENEEALFGVRKLGSTLLVALFCAIVAGFLLRRFSLERFKLKPPFSEFEFTRKLPFTRDKSES